MSDRERNLLVLLVAMAFIAANLLGYKVWFEPTMAKLKQDRENAEREADFNLAEAGDAEILQKDRDWLERHEPQPNTVGRVKTSIQQLAEREATRMGLTLKRGGYGGEVIEPSFQYHRARYQIEVNGLESSIYRWLDRLHNPNEFRAVTYLRLSPQRDDATRADCEVYLDQWFVPEGGQS